MNTFSHVLMGKLIYQNLKEKNRFLKKSSFIFGNIKPNFTASLLKQPHRKNKFIDFVKSELVSLSNSAIEYHAKISTDYSERLGVICHFIANFFLPCT